MPWNWQLTDWPKFYFNYDEIAEKERTFLLSAGTTDPKIPLQFQNSSHLRHLKFQQ